MKVCKGLLILLAALILNLGFLGCRERGPIEQTGDAASSTINSTGRAAGHVVKRSGEAVGDVVRGTGEAVEDVIH